MADEEDDRTQIFQEETEERTKEFNASPEIRALQERLKRAAEAARPPRLEPEREEMTVPRIDRAEVLGPRATNLQPRGSAGKMPEPDVTHPAIQRPQPPPPARRQTQQQQPARPTGQPQQPPQQQRPSRRPPTGAIPQTGARPPTGGFRQSGDRPPTGGFPQTAGQSQPIPAPPSTQGPPGLVDPDLTVLTPPESHTPKLSRGLVPREKPAKSRASVDVLIEAHEVAQQIGGLDATVIGYASSVSGFHELEVMGRAMPIKRPRGVIFGISLMLGLTMTGALATMLLQEWTSPSRIAVFAAIAVAIVATLSGLMAATTFRKSLRGAAVGAAWGIIASLGCPIVAAAWAKPEIRASILNNWRGYNQTLHDALDDPSELVSAAACREILQREDDLGRGKLLPILTVRTEAATGCLRGDESEMAHELSQLIAKRWSRELLVDAEDDGARSRKLASAMASLPIPQAERDLRLLSCAFNGPTSVVRAHCAETIGATIGANTWNDRLKLMIGVDTDSATSRGIVAMAFDSNSLRPEHEKLATRVGASEDASRWYAVEFASGAISRGVTGPIPEIAGNLEGKCPNLDVVGLPESRDTWFTLVSDAVAMREEHKTPEPALCLAANNTLVGDAIENGQSLVHASIRIGGKKEARGIDAGWLDLNKHMPQTHSDLQGMIPKGVSDSDSQEMMRIMSSSGSGQNHPVFLGAPAGQQY